MNNDLANLTESGGALIATLLKAPEKMAGMIAQRDNPLAASLVLLVTAIISYALFGLAMGVFGGFEVAAMDVIKAPLIAVASLLICYPSLYVFACVNGSPLTLAQAFFLGSSCLAMLGLLLVGLAPVVWLFSVSTASVSFMTILALLVWFFAAFFVMSYIGKLQSHELFSHGSGIQIWFLVLVLVTFQLVTCLRPILSSPAGGWWTGEKMFFLEHLSTAMKL